MIRIASSQAFSTSTLRTTMLWNGLRHGTSSPASRAASRASGVSRSKLRLNRAIGPTK